MSPAETTIQQYQPAPVAGSLPVDPLTNFRSSYPLGFSGCMFCGNTAHSFRECPRNYEPGAAALFFKNLFAHKPHLRKRPVDPKDILPPLAAAAPAVPAPALPTHSFPATPVPPYGLPPPPLPLPVFQPPPTTVPPPSTTDPPLDVTSTSAESPAHKRLRFFLQIVKSFPAPATLPRCADPMPIAIDNGLPHLTLDLASNPKTDPSLCGLMDTCGALNTGWLPFHLWLKSERPDLVAEYVSFDDVNPFEPIKLGGAIRDPEDFASADHGNLTAVIRYFTPYVDRNDNGITLSFALGPDVTVNTIFGLPLLCDFEATICLPTNSLRSPVTNTSFLITRAAATFGLPSNCTFDPAVAAVLPNHSLSSSSVPTLRLTTASDDISDGFLCRTISVLR